MRSILAHFLVLIGLLMLANGCDEPFNPKAPFEQRLVTYSVLTNQSDMQFVQLYLNYNPPGFDPYAVTTTTYDTSASVVISSPTQNFPFHDTLLTPTLRAFVAPSFRPIPGTAYTLAVVSSRYGTVSASTKMPGKGFLSVPDQSRLLFPKSFSTENIEIDCVLAPEARGFLVRFFLDFTLQSDTTFRGEVEIPMSYGQDSTGLTAPVYPQLQRVDVPNPSVLYPVTNYLQTIGKISDRYSTRIIPTGAKMYLVQVDKSLYTYYNVANGFQDKFSIRTDQPDYTNIQNGLGVFGSFNIDSLSIHL